MKQINLMIAGFGGQGILFVGKILAYAGLLEGKQVSWLPSYGPEMRGGTANCSVCLSNELICSPLVTKPDILIAMNQPSYDKFVDKVVMDGVVIIDSSLITIQNQIADKQLISIPATQLASEQKLSKLANIILLGGLLKKTKILSLDSIQKALQTYTSKPELLQSNLKALSIGDTMV